MNPMTDLVRKRSVVDCLQATFKRGFSVPPVLSFDEAMLPSRSRYNPTRQYLKDKPHKWGTKLFVTCCATTAYCLRFEVYCGKKQHLGATPLDNHAGAAAVLRNLDFVLPAVNDSWRVVVTDRFYTSVQLALQLLHRHVYTAGTVMTNRLGLPKSVVDVKKTKKKDLTRGDVVAAVSRDFPLMTVLSWVDSKPVFFLSTGGSLAVQQIQRRLKGGQRVRVPAPKCVVDYQRWMGGVDIHDQLRMQRYSIQLAHVYKKYYKSLFMGALDLALVNAYILWKAFAKAQGFPVPAHDHFLEMLQKELVTMTQERFDAIDDGLMSPPPAPTRRQSSRPGHRMEECPDYYIGPDKTRKRRHRACKVCSLLRKPGDKRTNTKYYCDACSEGVKRLHLCNVPRHPQYGDAASCFQIWHEQWECGADLPALARGKKIQMRKPGKKRARQIFEEEDEEEKDGEEEQ